MKHLHKFLLFFCWGISSIGISFAQTPERTTDSIVVFRFLPKEEMFFLKGNEMELNNLYLLIDKYRTEIMDNQIPLRIDSYCASLPTAKENLMTAYKRANRVKSELILHKGLKETSFITGNYPRAYYNNKDIVVVTLCIPTEIRQTETIEKKAPSKEAKREASATAVRKQPEPVAEKEPALTSEPIIKQPAATSSKPYCIAVRTNLLYDVLLLPTLGIEWRINNNIGVKLDGSLSLWGNKRDKLQKMWLVNPEARWYMGKTKSLYTGISGNYGECNVYKYLLGGIISKDTGYQGKMWGAGVTVGYQLHLSHCFLIDFNLGLGYTHFKYDRFSMDEGVRVYKEKDKSKNLLGPTQAGISLTWIIGNK